MDDDRDLPDGFPSRERILEFIRESTTPVGKREIARAFQLKGDDRIALKAILKELEADGAVERGRGRRMATPTALPAVAVVTVVEIDTDGDVVAHPLQWPHDAPPPRIYMRPERRGQLALGEGDRVLAALKRLDDRTYEGRTIRRLEGADARVLGIYERRSDGGRLRPTDKRIRTEFLIAPADDAGARTGELVLADVLPAGRLGLRRARVVERLGSMHDPKAISLIAIHSQGLPTDFSTAALNEAETAAEPALQGRVDLRGVPLVTIDGADARDFDDAVWAEPDGDPENSGGWTIMVAIADVAFYVRRDTALDRAAYARGNSAYFPDRVVPMLPEALSNGLCSLKPGIDRACLAVRLRIDADGSLIEYRFVRALMRSAARLTYEQVQAAMDGAPDDVTGPLVDTVIRPLYGAFAVLNAARAKRGTLELDLPERRVLLSESGSVLEIGRRRRLDSHRLIEEFMIAANVAAARMLEDRRRPCLYRVHAEPERARIEALRDFLDGLGYRLARGQVLKPEHFTRILDKARGTPEAALIAEIILRSQAQAVYSPDNIGHFGLALGRYAHFTSPIRRYADLIVHRCLIRALGLGDDGIDDETMARLDTIGDHISMTERRAAAAERDALDRYAAAYLADRVGGTFSGHIGGVTRFGLFVTLDETGADGIVPVSSLPDDFYDHDEDRHALVGRRWGRLYRLGAPLKVRLLEADPIIGSMVFGLLDDEGADLPTLSGRPDTSPRPRTGKGRDRNLSRGAR